MLWQGGRRWSSGWITVALVTCAAAAALGVVGYGYLTGGGHAGHGAAADPVTDYVDIARAPLAPPSPPVLPGAATGTWHGECGRNENGIHNADNVVASPGKPGGAHHLHDYVGNVSTNALSTNESLAAAATTCTRDDRSSYYWPVLRLPAQPGDAASRSDEADGNHGRILTPDSVLLEFHGSPVGNVVGMPQFLRVSTGNPHGFSGGGVGTEHVQWTCSGAREHVTNRYPRCPPGQRVVRVFDFPSCWNGTTTDTPGHKAQVVFTTSAGTCPVDTFPVPELHMEIAYTVPAGMDYSVDAFPEEQHSPVADHGDFIDVLPDELMAEVVSCLNTGKRC